MESTTSKPWVIYGLAANPPHKGHWESVHFLSQDHFVILVPSLAHAFGKTMAPYELRCQWLKEAQPDFHLNIEVSKLEQELFAQKSSIIYSIDLLEEIERRYGVKARLAVGPDNAHPDTWKRFKDHERIVNEYGRIDLPEEVPENLDLHSRSTLIRQRIQSGKLSLADLAYFVGPTIAPSVAHYYQSL